MIPYLNARYVKVSALFLVVGQSSGKEGKLIIMLIRKYELNVGLRLCSANLKFVRAKNSCRLIKFETNKKGQKCESINA